MPKVMVVDNDLNELFVAEFSRVPSIGESISISDSNGDGNTYKVEWVCWDVIINNSPLVEAKVSLDLDDSDHWFHDWFSESKK